MLASRLMRMAPDTAWNAVTVILTDDAGIAAHNKACFGRAGATDVISCRYARTPGEHGPDGEVIVNVERALTMGRRLGRRRGDGWGPGLELALYIAHGFDHLSGASDRTARLRSRMLRRERSWLAAPALRDHACRLVQSGSR